MRCSIEGCPGEYEQREVVHTVRQGIRIIVIDHVPAEVCTTCGDCYSHRKQCARSRFSGVLSNRRCVRFHSMISHKQNRHKTSST